MNHQHTNPNWLETGWQHIWLPYTQMQNAPMPQPVVDACGSVLTLENGKKLIDGVANWWSACHGHKHPYIIAKMQEQLNKLPHVMFGGLANEEAYTLATRLCKITPAGLDRVLLVDSGSVAVEVALKMAIQYWRNKEQNNKNRFICFRNGYHGDTIGAMSVSDPQQCYHQAFKHILIPQYLVDVPCDDSDFTELENLLSSMHQHIAACIIEPLIQGAGGMRFHTPETLARIRKLCSKYDILFIADEIAVGFGRTGTMFACEAAEITPDILCLGKALTGGNITFAATLATADIYNEFLGDDWDKALMHGTTYMGTPLASAAANASLDLFEIEPRLHQVAGIEQQLNTELAACLDIKYVKEIRVKGAIGVVELPYDKIDICWFRNKFIELGVWLRPIENIVYIAPPFVITKDELTKLTNAVFQAIYEWSKLQA